jgi:predicted nucleotidyltransferase
MSDEESGVFLSLPLPNQQVFRYQAADDILELLYRNPHREFTVTQLRETTGHGGKSVDNAIKILESLELIQQRREGRQSLIQINQARIRKPDDPLLEIPQQGFRKPVREFLEEARERQGENLVAVILFGSVARGEADRASDIDIQVIVEEDLLESRRDLQDVRQIIEEKKFGGNRYEVQLLVESVESAESYGEKLQEIFSEGIKLYSTEKFEDVREEVFSG